MKKQIGGLLFGCGLINLGFALVVLYWCVSTGGVGQFASVSASLFLGLSLTSQVKLCGYGVVTLLAPVVGYLLDPVTLPAFLRRGQAVASEPAGEIEEAWPPAQNRPETQLPPKPIRFEEAQTVFDDPLAAIFQDKEHSESEVREVIIGHSQQNRLLFVCFTQRQDGIRLISARPVTFCGASRL